MNTRTTQRPLRRLLPAFALAALIVGLVVVAFGRQDLSSGGTEIRAQFSTANQLRSGSVVRVAGLDVGRVVRVEASPSGRALVTLRLDDRTPVVRQDARLDIEPRLAFEGNFYVRLDPGTPATRPLAAGATIPTRQTSAPVQLDEVMSSFDGDVRNAVRSITGEMARGLGGSGAATGSAGVRSTVRELDRALLGIERVSRAVRGETPGELPRAIDATGDLAGVMARRRRELMGAVQGFSTVFRALADHDRQLRQSIVRGANLVRIAPAALDGLDALLPPLATAGRDLRPVLRALPATQGSFSVALAQLATFLREPELPALLRALDAPVRALPRVEQQLAFFLPSVTALSRCVSRNVMPVLNAKIDDGVHTVDQRVWEQFAHATAGLTGASSDFDANGTTVRAGLASGDNWFQGTLPGLGETVSSIGGGSTGVNPPWLGYGRSPEKRPDVPCATQEIADLRSKPARLPGTERRVPAGPSLTPSERQAETRSLLQRVRDSLVDPDRPRVPDDRGNR